MKIQGSNISMASISSSMQSYTREERLRAGMPANSTGAEFLAGDGSNGIKPDIVELSQEARDKLAGFTETPAPEKLNSRVSFELSDEDKLKITLLESMLRSITGKRIRIRVMERLDLGETQTVLKIKLPQTLSPAGPKTGVNLQYELHESYYERAQMTFSSQGIIKTADGRDINFSVELNMSREFASKTGISVRTGTALDPLVINYEGAPRLSGTKFSFDLDNDGNKEQISFVGPGSGFLALDINGDGVVNNGGELFGPRSGNGFSDLSQYDDDGNQWIDENDDIFSSLRIWTKDAEGKDTLFALGQKGIGAIYLGSLNTIFSFKDLSNEEQARITHSGIFIKEDGSVGTVQQVDMII